MANLLMALYDSGRTTFTTAEAAEITCLTTVPIASAVCSTKPENADSYRSSNAASS